ncbi:uncharacterized protein LOC116430084 [Nomia melanderi]|uniref:uncharacterized protein LOC116430084 n=1 Tax=Nomia melanderi TaxID=2448451 RepID=UPI0013045981|nr:uncharacterized protein LOC116430084 [Nomia melanderi]XP_031839612.1 uncharacterized protein LOC116430084 [Nomia melanderi]
MGRKKCRSKSCRLSKADGNGRGGNARNRRDESRAKEEDARSKSEEIGADRASNVPIDVHSRLSYPLIRGRSSEDLETSWSIDESDEEETRLVLTVKPRFVFVPSLCAVCLERSKVFCERCRMVSYCSPVHRAQGLRQHRDLCGPLTEIRSSFAASMSVESEERLDAERYRVYRLQLLAILESKSGRPLKLWEREIVLYPRVCRICRRFSEDFECCAACGMESFCRHHRQPHDEWCKEFQVLRRCLFLQHNHGHVDPKIPRGRERLAGGELALPGTNFDELTHRVYGDCSYYREMDCYTYAMLSHVCTIPLTTLYAMQICCSEWREKPELNVHVLGAEFQFEGVNLHVWERMFLHFLPKLRRLRLALVGPELELPNGVPANLLSKVNLCPECKAADRLVDVRFRPRTLYHEFVRDRVEHAEGRPDLICAFNPGLYRKTGFAGEDTWPETIREFSRMSTPVVVTSYTANEIFWEISRIKSIDREVEVLLEPQRNPFASIKPDRNFVSDDTNPLIYKNYYVAIVAAEYPNDVWE